MSHWRWWCGAALAIPLIAASCGSDDSGPPPINDWDASAGSGGDASVNPDTSTGGKAGSAGAGGANAGAGGASVGGNAGNGGAAAGNAGNGGEAGAAAGAAGNAGAAGAPACITLTCQGKVYECGDCLDNDGDGKIDMQDPDCLGPCHNNERGFDPEIPGGGNSSNCKLECYFDQDTGAGNDDCYWNHKCDPLAVAPDFYPEGPSCTYDPNANTPGTNGSCTELQAAQSQLCTNFCQPLTPNGCDCFGCCELPAESGNWVWLGSTELLPDGGGAATCTLDVVSDPDKCHPCTPVPGCWQPCEHCKLCLGKTELPADCFAPDAGAGGSGTGGSGGSPEAGTGGTPGSGGSPEAGTGGSGGTQSCGGQICAPTSQPCGLWCQPPCPTGQFCLTGCCQKNPS